MVILSMPVIICSLQYFTILCFLVIIWLYGLSPSCLQYFSYSGVPEGVFSRWFSVLCFFFLCTLLSFPLNFQWLLSPFCLCFLAGRFVSEIGYFHRFIYLFWREDLSIGRESSIIITYLYFLTFIIQFYLFTFVFTITLSSYGLASCFFLTALRSSSMSFQFPPLLHWGPGCTDRAPMKTVSVVHPPCPYNIISSMSFTEKYY